MDGAPGTPAEGRDAPAKRRTALSWPAAALVALAVVSIGWVATRAVRRALGDRFTIERTTYVVSRVDGQKYRVHEGLAEPQRAADTLAALNGRVIDLMRYLRDRYVRAGRAPGERGARASGPRAGHERRGVRYESHEDGEGRPDGPGPAASPRQRVATRLLARYNPDNLAENAPSDPKTDTSYTIDKGALVALCLRNQGAGQLHDLDTLTFVTLHEMAHIGVDVTDHPAEFWAAFRFLLEAAEDAGVYVSPDYAAHPRAYCGIKIDYSPRWDARVTPL